MKEVGSKEYNIKSYFLPLCSFVQSLKNIQPCQIAS